MRISGFPHGGLNFSMRKETRKLSPIDWKSRWMGGGWRGGRAADHETGGNQELALHFWIFRIFGLCAQRLKGGARQIGARQADSGERRQRVFGEVHKCSRSDEH